VGQKIFSRSMTYALDDVNLLPVMTMEREEASTSSLGIADMVAYKSQKVPLTYMWVISIILDKIKNSFFMGRLIHKVIYAADDDNNEDDRKTSLTAT